ENQYKVWGYCGTPGATISFSGTGSTPTNTTCNGGTWTIDWNFADDGDGDLVISVRQGTSPVVTRTLVKDTANCNLALDTQTASGDIDARFGSSAGPHYICNVQQMARLQSQTSNWSKH